MTVETRAKATPGPYEMDARPIPPAIEGAVHVYAPHGPDKMRLIAVVTGDNAEANARLLAAAPDLLAALEAFVDCAPNIPEPLLSGARAAILAARGED